MKSHHVILTGNTLTIKDIINVARNYYTVSISEEAKEEINKSRAYVDNLVDNDEVVYGITTGFGEFSKVKISKEDSKELQKNLIISHACGVGNPFKEEVVRAMMLLRVNALCKGFSGIRLSTIETLVNMLNKKVTPMVPEKGSLGASGDLAPLSHMVLPMLGYGEAYFDNVLMNGKKAMELAGIEVIELTSKEGLALINGTQAMTAVGSLTAYDAMNLLKLADISASLTMEALSGITCAFSPKLHEIRPHSGQVRTAANMLKLLEGSERVTKQGEKRVQDAYSLRCIPQIHGASKDALEYVLGKIEIEINSVTDNPIIVHEDDRAISGGNFHGQPMALSFDFLGIAIAEIANVSERRIERLVNPQLNDLPAFLTKKGGLNSGFMIAQYSAAALVSENKVLAHPASVDSIPSSANQEDHVSMGTIAARKASEIYFNAKKVIAIELLAAAQGVDLSNEGKKLAKSTQKAYDLIRKHAKFIEDDVVMYELFEEISKLIDSNEIVNSVEEILGKL